MFRSPIFWKIYLSSIVLIVATALTIGFLVTRRIEADELAKAERELRTYAVLLKDLAQPSLGDSISPELQANVKTLSGKVNARLTILQSDGLVIADSDEDPSKMDNHLKRPEIIAAASSEFGTTTRFSSTVKKNMMYTAIAVRRDNRTIGFVRAAYPIAYIEQQLAGTHQLLIGGALAAAVLALILGFLLARQVAKPLDDMTALAQSIGGGNYGERVPVKEFSGFATLARVLNSMAAKIEEDIAERETSSAALQEARDNLEVKIQERTDELMQANILLKRQVFERRRTEKMVETNEARYRNLIENASDIVYSYDSEGRFTSINSAGAEILGYSTDFLGKLTLHNLVVPEHQSLVSRMFQRKLAGEMKTTGELDVLTKQGERLTLEINSQPVFKNGEFVGAQGIARNITERRAAEDKLRRNEEWLRAIFEASRDGIMVESQEKIIYANTAFAQLLGLTDAADLTGKSIAQILFATDDLRYFEYRRHSRNDKNLLEIEINPKDGAAVRLEVGFSIASISGKTYSIATFRNLSERKAAQKQFDANH